MRTLIAWSLCFVLGGSLLPQAPGGATGKNPPPAAAPALQVALLLLDGSRVVGTPSIDHLKLKSQYASMDIPLSRMRALEYDPASRVAIVRFLNGDRLDGRLAITEIAMKTPSGPVVVPIARLRKLHVGGLGEDLPEGLVLYYSFDADEGGKVTDSSASASHGKVRGAAYTNEGKIFGAMSFSGDGEAVIVGNPPSLHLQDLSIMAWIKRGDTANVSKTTAYGEIFGYGHGGYVLGIHQDGYIYLSQADVSIGAISSFKILDKDFHHIAVTKKGNQVVFYLDGIADPAESYDGTGDFLFTTDAAVGARSDDLHKCFIGVIDEVSVFKRVLSADEIKGVYETQK